MDVNVAPKGLANNVAAMKPLGMDMNVIDLDKWIALPLPISSGFDALVPYDEVDKTSGSRPKITMSIEDLQVTPCAKIVKS